MRETVRKVNKIAVKLPALHKLGKIEFADLGYHNKGRMGSACIGDGVRGWHGPSAARGAHLNLNAEGRVRLRAQVELGITVHGAGRSVELLVAQFSKT